MKIVLGFKNMFMVVLFVIVLFVFLVVNIVVV